MNDAKRRHHTCCAALNDRATPLRKGREPPALAAQVAFCSLRLCVKSKDNVTERASFCQKIMSPRGHRSFKRECHRSVRLLFWFVVDEAPGDRVCRPWGRPASLCPVSWMQYRPPSGKHCEQPDSRISSGWWCDGRPSLISHQFPFEGFRLGSGRHSR